MVVGILMVETLGWMLVGRRLAGRHRGRRARYGWTVR